MADSSGYPVIHGGREYEEDFEFEGIPYVDAYSNQFTNSLAIPTGGVQLLQLTTGAGDASQPGGGTGAFNVVAKRGTYPGYAQVAARRRWPRFRPPAQPRRQLGYAGRARVGLRVVRGR